uniref:Titin n=1 Tax=Scophthalmus maximus TaxID=52904 RepID=A0A8D3AWU0_SCOMX
MRWVKCNKRTVTDLRFKASGLTPGHEYEFRILAENNAGLSQPSPSSPFYKAIDTIFQPGPPGNPRVLDTTKSSITLAWNKPVYDGGSEITGYIVETCLPEEDEWTIHTPKKGWTATSFTITNLKENQDYKINICATNCEGVGEPAAVPGTPKAEDRLLPPEIELGADLRKVVSIRACSTLRLFVPIKGRPAPEVKWSREHGVSLDKANIEITPSFTTLQVDNVDRFDGGKYMVTVENASGSKTAFVNVRVLDSPGAPQNLMIKEVTRDSVSLVWDTEFVVTGLTEDEIYEFRVIARNAAGVFSQPSDSTGAITAKDEVDPPKIDLEAKYSQAVVVNAGETFRLEVPVAGHPKPTITWTKDGAALKQTTRVNVTDSTHHTTLTIKDATKEDGGMYSINISNTLGSKDATVEVITLDKPGPPTGPVRLEDISAESITLNWEPPTYTGGCPISNYVVEKRDTTTINWVVVSATIARTTLKVANLKTGEYKVRICAINKLGVGEPTDIQGVVKPVDKIDPPEMILDSELRKGIVVRAGGSMKICIPFKGRPTPEISWAKEDGELPSKVQIETAEDYTQISVDICDRYDAGKYIVNMENTAGTKSAFVSVKVLDTPGAPMNLAVKDIKRESVTLTWEPPLIDGGARIKNYLVEKRESTRKVYSNVDNKCTKTSYRITGLTEGTIYYFRVLAENEFGLGQPAETGDSVKTSEPPLAVGKVTLTEVTKTTASLSWEKPDHDGGSRIMGYYIEMQPVGSEEWVVAATTKTCEGTVTGLSAGHEYLFRVTAFNEKGKSDPRPLAAPVTAKDVTFKPRFKMAFNTYSLHILWSKLNKLLIP